MNIVVLTRKKKKLIFALIRPRNLNIVSNFRNHKIFSDYKLFFSKSPKCFNTTISFLASHNLGHQKKGFVGTAEGWLPEVPHISPELDQEVHITIRTECCNIS